MHEWKEMRLVFDEDGLRRIVIDAGDPLPSGSILRGWRWFLWGGLRRAAVIGELDQNFETIVVDRSRSGVRLPQQVLEDGSLRTVGGAIVRFTYEDSLGTIELDRAAVRVPR